ncbi:hypothetical protein ACSBPU_12325 [Parapusillimonas sp. JC17]|uniref:hypothetical protein n=1 Tax=Parapusillimonas sp. JC17 TaxID=3445768 RepID=UPI003FA12A57
MTEPFILPLGDAALVFGLDWFPLVGRRAAQAGKRLAQRHRASHILLAGTPPAAVGMLAMKKSRGQGAMYSAAQNLAQLHPRGTYAMLLELGDKGCWLAVAHDGVVVSRTDRLYRTRHDAVHFLGELRPAFPRLQLLGSSGAPALPDLAALGAARTPDSRLQPLRRWQPFLPRPVQYFMLALLLAVLGPKLWAFMPDPAAASHGVVSVDPGAAWQKAVAQSVSGRMLHGVPGTQALFDALYSLPLWVGGWKLTRAQCLPLASVWQCKAHFERAGPPASNQTFLDHAQAAWTVEFTPTERVTATWRMPSQGGALGQYRLASSDDNERALVSELQAIKPGFAQLHVSNPSALPVSAPIDSQGKALPRPARQPVYYRRALRIVAPLRSAAVLLPYTAHMAWDKAELVLGATDAPTLTHSGLMLTLEGAIYESSKVPSSSPPAAMGHAPGAVLPPLPDS